MADVFAGRFELIDPIGAGGTGTVWRAWDRRLERLCAAKVLRQRHAGALLRFVREQGLRLDHPNILSPYSWAAVFSEVLPVQPATCWWPAARATSMPRLMLSIQAAQE